MVEKIIEDYSNAYDIKYVSLRYFNAAGCDLDAEIGEEHDPETHLIPLILDAALGKREDIKVFGTDYDTRDGSAIRDYIYVTDLSQAHILALKYIQKGGTSDKFNLGNGDGYSVKEVIETVKEVTKKDFKVSYVKRRAGDPAGLVGSAKKAIEILKWSPQYALLEDIIKSAWNWHQKGNS